MVRIVRATGRRPVQRNTLYGVIERFDGHDPADILPLVERAKGHDPLRFLRKRALQSEPHHCRDSETSI
jgi:FO synthase